MLKEYDTIEEFRALSEEDQKLLNDDCFKRNGYTVEELVEALFILDIEQDDDEEEDDDCEILGGYDDEDEDDD